MQDSVVTWKKISLVCPSNCIGKGIVWRVISPDIIGQPSTNSTIRGSRQGRIGILFSWVNRWSMKEEVAPKSILASMRMEFWVNWG